MKSRWLMTFLVRVNTRFLTSNPVRRYQGILFDSDATWVDGAFVYVIDDGNLLRLPL